MGNNLVTMKKCTKCNKIKLLIQFHISKIFKDNHNNWCKNCIKKYRRNYYIINKQKIKIKNKLYRTLNRNKIRIHKKITREKINKQERIYWKKRRKSDINYKLKTNLRKRVWQALCGKGKSKSTIKLLGCSIIKFKNHLKSKFTEGMSWQNYGKWHIDHIIPCVSFDLRKESEQKKCFNYKNLQPLWAKDNRIKYTSIILER